MKSLEDMTIGQRFLLMIIIVLAVIFILAFIGWISGGWDEAPAQELAPSKFDADVIEIDKEAVRGAYHDQVKHLFAVWAKDEQGQPGRALVGVRQARRMFIEAMTEIEKRERK